MCCHPFGCIQCNCKIATSKSTSKMFLNISFLLFGVSILFIDPIDGDDGDRSYNMELNSFKPTEGYDDTWIDWTTIHMKKVSRNKFGINGDVKVKRNIGNEQIINVDVFKINAATGVRSPPITQYLVRTCDAIKDYEDIYQNLVKYSNFPEGTPCPFPKGDYTFDNFVMEGNFFPDNFPKGDYIIQITLKDVDKSVNGYELDLTLT